MAIWSEEADGAVGPDVGVRRLDPPAALVHLAVVVAAEQQPVGECGGAPGGPRHEVMGIGKPRGTIAPGEATPVIAGGERLTLWPREEANLPAQLDRNSRGIEHDAPNRCIAGEATQGGAGDPERGG